MDEIVAVSLSYDITVEQKFKTELEPAKGKCFKLLCGALK